MRRAFLKGLTLGSLAWHGPAEGREGLLKNVDLVRRLRETVGDATDLMFDAFMGWDLPQVRLTERPGFGIELDPAKAEKQVRLEA
jgi:L-alanine-DL-glutamate epimerase-like enolase superfamily enzyme